MCALVAIKTCFHARKFSPFLRRSSTSTIFALSSGSIRSALATVRVSGPHAAAVLRRIANLKQPIPRKAFLRRLVHPCSGVHLDTAIVLWFPSPHSYTGEDCCELHVHGGVGVVNAVLGALSHIEGVRHAEPGEFTKRAFMHGKMDLAEVEGLADLLKAETEAQRVQALAQMEGSLSKLYKQWTHDLKMCLANVEAFIDFSEDQGIEETILDSAAAQAEKLATEIQIHLLDGRRGERLRDGVKVAIIGRTNVGKSSLFNALCQRDAAIVSPIAGTTRDVIESTLEIGGYPAVFSDTAGLRHSNDPVEQEGILRAQHWAANADLALIVVEARELLQLKPTTDFIDDHLKELGVESCAQHRLIIFNKLDLLSDDEQVAVEQHAKSMCVDNCFTSCTTQQGISDLVKILGGHLEDLCGKPADLSPILTRERHRRHLDQCLKHLKLFNAEVRHDSVIGAEHLRIALSHLGRITGRVFTEEILDVIFRDFCIGK
ncbi:tRNA modification GTPase GTPBP3, mitochondrial isoform X1 [Dermacentor andersoni]|uniref:tRNA modification GTPase GTPBP3, mitochondrial isoform X1 n=1 Tax=Dermacentor andersoni TaxID=34620 RepID=UPI002155F2F5|nr:tRNA modification GTPase GTPBP3, mitochondrial-like isoform X1 [Dermacentor andersoni]